MFYFTYIDKVKAICLMSACGSSSLQGYWWTNTAFLYIWMTTFHKAEAVFNITTRGTN